MRLLKYSYVLALSWSDHSRIFLRTCLRTVTHIFLIITNKQTSNLLLPKSIARLIGSQDRREADLDAKTKADICIFFKRDGKNLFTGNLRKIK
jgi:hypothetical protein